MNALRQLSASRSIPTSGIGGSVRIPNQSRFAGTVSPQRSMSTMQERIRQVMAQRGQPGGMTSRFSGGMAAPAQANALRMFRGMGGNQPISAALNRGISGGLHPAQRVNMQGFRMPASANYLGV